MLRFYLAHFCLMLLVFCGCTTPFGQQFNDAFEEQLTLSPEGKTCGDGNDLAAIIPDCPLEGVCFTDACEAHDACYGTCGLSRRECDLRFHADVVAVCNQVFPLQHFELRECLYTAFTYWAVIERRGQPQYDTTQEFAGCLEPPPPVVVGACCMPGSPATCTPVDETHTCPPDGLLFLGLTCDDVIDELSGCPVPPNDDCSRKTPVCDATVQDTDLGRCSQEDDTLPHVGVCSLTSQDCPFGEPCLPLEGEAFRCRVPTDNRLALTDGPEGVGLFCGASELVRLQADIWYEYVAPCSGTLTLHLCDNTDYDAMLAIYGSNDPEVGCTCPLDDGLFLGCDDDSCGGPETGSLLTIADVVEGACYVIRVGGWAAPPDTSEVEPQPARGRGQLDIGILCE